MGVMSILAPVGWLLLASAALCAWRAYRADLELRAMWPPGHEQRGRDDARIVWPASPPWESLGASFEAAAYSVIPHRWRRSAYGTRPPVALDRVLRACVYACGLAAWGLVALAAGLA